MPSQINQWWPRQHKPPPRVSSATRQWPAIPAPLGLAELPLPVGAHAAPPPALPPESPRVEAGVRPPLIEGAWVDLNARGRSQIVKLDNVTLTGVCHAAQLAFGIPPDQELAVARQGDERLESNNAFSEAVASSATLYLQVPESAQCCIGELQQKQISILRDQMATLRQEQADLQEDLEGMKAAVERELRAWGAGNGAVRQEMAELKASGEWRALKGAQQLKTLEAVLASMQQALSEEAATRERADREGRSQLQEMREAVQSAGDAREQREEEQRVELEEVRQAVSLEMRVRQEVQLDTEQALQALRAALAQTSEVQAAAEQEARQHLLDMKQVARVEERERFASHTDLAAAVKDLRTGLQSEARERADEAGKLAAKCEEAGALVEAETLARQQATSELTQHLSVALENALEEHLRFSEDTQLSVNRAVHDLGKKVDEEVSGLLRRISDESEARQEEASKTGRSVAAIQGGLASEAEQRLRDVCEVGRRVDECCADVRAELAVRLAAVEELAARPPHRRAGRRDASTAGCQAEESGEAARSELERQLHWALMARSELERRLRGALAEEQPEQTVVHTSPAVPHGDARALLGREAQLHGEGDLALLRTALASHEAPEKDLRQQRVLDAKLQQGLACFARLRTPDKEIPEQSFADQVQAKLDAMRDGMATVIEAVQQEGRLRANGHSKSQEDLEGEARLRHEAVADIHLAIAECRNDLEICMHELRVPSSLQHVEVLRNIL